MKRICLIGAGPSGLSFLRSFVASRERRAYPSFTDMKIICYEKQSETGGMWNYSWRIGLDEYGNPQHLGMYHHLLCNAPKEWMEYPDYSFDECFRAVLPSFIPRCAVLKYIQGRSERYDLEKYIKFNAVVKFVEYFPDENEFSVTVYDQTDDVFVEERFDYVVVGSGHYSFPYMPEVEGMDAFKGRVLHSHDFRNPAEFSGLRVLIVGSSSSAEDIALLCEKFGSASVSMSFRHNQPCASLAFDLYPIPISAKGKSVRFADSSERIFDAIIFCTGYRHTFDFMADDIRLRAKKNCYFPDNLYKGVVFIDKLNVFYLAMQKQSFTFNMFDVQSMYVLDIIAGRIALPNKLRMHEDLRLWKLREEAISNKIDYIELQKEYIENLLGQVEHPTLDIRGSAEIAKQAMRKKNDDIRNFRYGRYKSLVTGRLAAAAHAPWVAAKDDSLESYLASVESAAIRSLSDDE